MHPGALIPDIGHFEEVWIEPCFAERVPKERFVRPRRAGGDHNAIQVVFPYPLFHQFLSVVRARVQTAFRVNHIRECLRKLDQHLHVDYGRDIRPAVAYEDPNSCIFARYVCLRGVFLRDDQAELFVLQPPKNLRCGGGGLHDRLGDVLRLRERASHVDPIPTGFDRSEG